MKKLSNKKILTIGLGIIAVCLLISGIYVIANRSEKREPTAAETSAYAAYDVDWQAVGEGSDREIILSLCTFVEEKTIGENLYKSYTSDVLGAYLYDFGEMMEIAMLNDLLYVQYTTPAGNMITLGYSDTGLCEKSIYDLETDLLYYENNGQAEVWTKFRNGFQWGA